jgi:uncharacterized membrane protein
VESQLEEKDILQIAELLFGAKSYVLQKFVPVKVLDKKFLNEKSYSDEKFQKIKKHLEHQIPSITIR